MCNARQVFSACREQERIKAINTPRPHKTTSELNGARRRRPKARARPCAPTRQAAPPSERVPAATAQPWTAQPGAGRDPTRARTAPFTRAAAAAPCRAPLHSSHAHRRKPTSLRGHRGKNAKWRKDSHVRHFLNPDDYCGSVRADGVYTHYRRRHDPLLHGTNSRALRVDRLDRTINSYTCPARGGLEAPACTRDSRANS